MESDSCIQMENTLLAFEDQVLRLAKPGQEILASMTPDEAHMFHMSVGLSTELGELALLLIGGGSEAAAIEEYGDFEFYLEGLRQGIERLGDPLPSNRVQFSTKAPVTNTLFLSLVASTGHLQDAAVKRVIIYRNADYLEKVVSRFRRVERALDELYGVSGFTREQILQANLRKLSRRYQEARYSDAAANARADKQGVADDV